MARSLFWTEKVALSTLIVFLFSFQSVLSQPARSTSITYACRATNLETVIEFLSRTSGYHFIYSRDMIDVTRQVSLNVSNKPIEDVLTLISNQVNVSFKVQDRHIIVKAGTKADLSVKPVVVTQPVIAKSTIKPPVFRSIDGPLLSSTAKSISTRPIISNKSILESRLERRINELQRTLGPNVPRDIPPMYVNRINFNNRNNGWFAAIGTVVNDYSTSVEFQGGLRYLYAVAQPRWSYERGFYGAYGVGNSFMLMRNFSFNTIYMYSGNKQSATLYPFSSPLAQSGPAFQLTQTERHHQVKFAVQYALSRNVTVRLGPVLNYKSTTTELLPVSQVSAYYEGTFIYRQSGMPDIVYQNGQFTSQTIRQMQSWLGWEGAVSYRINFSNRR